MWLRRAGESEIRWDRCKNLCSGEDIFAIKNADQVHAVFDLDTGQYESVDILERDAIDRLWNAYESHITPSIRRIVDRSTPTLARDWFYLGQFVADLFVRGPDFESSILERLRRHPDPRAHVILPDTVNVNRRTERARILPAVWGSLWSIVHALPESRFITSDRGLCPTWGPDDAKGYAVPLTPSASLILYGTTMDMAPRLLWNESDWTAIVGHFDVDPDGVARANLAMWEYAHDAVFGAERADIEILDDSMRTVPQDLALADVTAAHMLSLDGDQRRRQRDLVLRMKAKLRTRPAQPELSVLSGLWKDARPAA